MAMNLRFWQKAEAAPSPFLTRLVTLGLANVAYPELNYDSLTKDGFKANVTVYACIMEIARAASGVPWVLYQRGAAKDTKTRKLLSPRTALKGAALTAPRSRKAIEVAEIEDHALLRLIERPNPQMGQSEFFETDVGFLMLSGNQYVRVILVDNGRRPKELWPMRPDRMKVVPSPDGLTVQGYEYTVQTEAGMERKVGLRPDEVQHVKLFNPSNDWYGQSPLQAAMRALLTDNEAVKWNYALLRNQARPTGMFLYQGTMGDEQFEEMKSQIDASYSGAANAGRPWLFESGVGTLKWESVGLSPAEMDWLSSRKLTKKEIAQVYGVPPELIGDSDAKTYSNYQEARRALYLETVLPYLDKKRDALNNWLTPMFGANLWLDYDRDQIEAIQEQQSALWARIQSAEWLTPNEKRVATGYDAWTPDTSDNPADMLMVSAALTPLTLVTAPYPEEPAGSQAQGGSDAGSGVTSGDRSTETPSDDE